MIFIPFDPKVSADQELRILLDQQAAVLRFYWNTKSEFWFLDVTSDETGVSLKSLRLVPGWPLFYVSKGLSPLEGDLMVLRMDSTVGDVLGYDDLGTRWGLFYLTPEELRAWEDANGLG